MLVLSRKVGERLVIGGNIIIVISRVAGNRVTIGIEAPDDIRIVRGELKPERERVKDTPRPCSTEPEMSETVTRQVESR